MSQSHLTSYCVPVPGPEYAEDDGHHDQRLEYIGELLKTWWQQFGVQALHSLIPYQRYKDAKRHENLKVGDVCLLRYDSMVKDKYRLCRVAEVYPDGEGVVRTVDVHLRPQDSREPLLPYRPKPLTVLKTGVQRLVLIQAAEDLPQAENGEE